MSPRATDSSSERNSAARSLSLRTNSPSVASASAASAFTRHLATARIDEASGAASSSPRSSFLYAARRSRTECASQVHRCTPMEPHATWQYSSCASLHPSPSPSPAPAPPPLSSSLSPDDPSAASFSSCCCTSPSRCFSRSDRLCGRSSSRSPRRRCSPATRSTSISSPQLRPRSPFAFATRMATSHSTAAALGNSERTSDPNSRLDREVELSRSYTVQACVSCAAAARRV
mmetsp:Transcript_1268/g.3974  ORF Transcript_1268/g.3974 Transcript_1268/m.3974 type:complete len:231 (+) Transcript_1268:864-1556(+)